MMAALAPVDEIVSNDSPLKCSSSLFKVSTRSACTSDPHQLDVKPNSPPERLQLIRSLTLGDGLPTRQPPFQPAEVPHEGHSIPQMRLTETFDLDFILDALQIGNDSSATGVDLGNPDGEGQGEVSLVGKDDALLLVLE